jgi:hypothetical protein
MERGRSMTSTTCVSISAASAAKTVITHFLNESTVQPSPLDHDWSRQDCLPLEVGMCTVLLCFALMLWRNCLVKMHICSNMIHVHDCICLHE